MDAHTDGNDDQHQQVCNAWVIGETAKDLSDLATGLGKIGCSFWIQSCPPFIFFCLARRSTLNALSALSPAVFREGFFTADLRLCCFGFTFGAAFLLFFLTVMRRDLDRRFVLKTQTTQKFRCLLGD